MQSLTGKTTGSQLTAAEWNGLPEEVQRVITAFGQSLDGGDLDQLAQSLVDHVHSANFYVDAGGADAYSLSTIGSRKSPTGYFDGMEIRFRAANANLTTSPTVNVAGIGVVNIKNEDLTSVDVGAISTGGDTLVRYNNATSEFLLYNFVVGSTPTSTFPRGYFFGFRHANDATDLDHDIVVAAGGSCRDFDDTQNIIASPASPFSKRINAAWTFDDGNGGLASPLALLPNTWYRFFVIAKANGTVDYGWDTSSTATLLLDANNGGGESPAFIKYQQIGWHLTDGSSNIRAYTQQDSDPNKIMWDAGHQSSVTISTTTSSQSVSVRAAPFTDAIISSFGRFDTGPTFSSIYVRVSSLDDPDPGGAGSSNFDFAGARSLENSHYSGGWVRVKANTNSDIRYRISYNVFSDQPRVMTLGYYYQPLAA